MFIACPLSHNTDFFSSHVYSDKFHVRAICPITELSTGSSHSCSQYTVTSAWAVVFACVRFVCVCHHISQPHLRVGRNALQLLVLLKALISALTSSGGQVNKQIMLKEASNLNAHTCIHRYCCVGPSVPLAERVNPCMESQATCLFQTKVS